MYSMDPFEKKYLKKRFPKFEIGDEVDVHVKIKEGEKERIQIFNGTVIRRHGHGLGETFTVRRVVQGEGVERIFPIHSTNIVTLKVKRKGRIRRAKLYYLRKRVGKATKVKEKIWTASEARMSASESKDAVQEVTEMLAPPPENTSGEPGTTSTTS